MVIKSANQLFIIGSRNCWKEVAAICPPNPHLLKHPPGFVEWVQLIEIVMAPSPSTSVWSINKLPKYPSGYKFFPHTFELF